jgi:L-2-hydroxycarboxylate dehydrogenase (NAD+)
MKKVSIELLEEKLLSFLKGFFSASEAKDCKDAILYAELRHKTGQGLLKLMGTEPLQGIKATAPLSIDHRTKISALITGSKNPSFSIAQTATRICLEKVSENGFGIVGANGIFSSTGALGFYAEQIAAKGYIGFCCARSPGATAPFGLSIPLFGTNPFAWSFPTKDHPVTFDMATSAITFYELVLAKMRGEKIPSGVAVDKNGLMTQDPTEAMAGGILPFDKSYKGSSLSMVVELLSGPLVGASFCDYETFDKDWGFLIFAIDPHVLVDRSSFIDNATQLVDIIRKNGGIVPGDNGREHELKCRQTGILDIDDEIAELLSIN